MAVNKIDRVEKEIHRTRVKIAEYQNRLKEPEAEKTEQEDSEEQKNMAPFKKRRVPYLIFLVLRIVS